MKRRVLVGALLAVAACLGALGASAALASGGWSGAPLVDPPSTLGLVSTVPTGYWVDVDESGTTTSGNLGGSGSLQATGQGNVNYGWAQECAPSSDGGPFSSDWSTCAALGRGYNSSGSPEQPGGFWFTGNQQCVNAGHSLSGSTFTWHVQLPETGHWHVDAYVPTWTSYGWGNQYILSSDNGQFQNYPFIQQAYHGQWVSLFGSYTFTANQDYTVQLTPTDGSDPYCHYQMADQMRWVYDGPLTAAPGNTSPPTISGRAEVGQTLTESHGSWTNSPTSYSYQWEDCDFSGSNCLPISGATSQSYTLAVGDVGSTIVVQETASNAGGSSGPASSAATAAVTPEPVGPPANTLPPTVIGTPQLGHTLSVLKGLWTETPTSLHYQWQECDPSGMACSSIPGAIASTYALSPSDLGHALRVIETASNARGSGPAVASKATAVIVEPQAPATPCPAAAVSTATAASLSVPTVTARQLKPALQTSRHGRSRRPARRGRRRRSAHTTLSRALGQMKTGGRRFEIALSLTPKVQSFFAQRCPEILRGTGVVNLRKHAARWTLQLPPSLGGTLQVVAVGRTTYLLYPGLSGASPKWIALRSARDYASFNSIPLLRDVVVLANPLRSLDLLASARRTGHGARASSAGGEAASVASPAEATSIASSAGTTPIASPARHDPRARSADTLKTSCDNGAQIANDAHAAPRRLTDTFDVGTTGQAAMLKSWAKNTISAKADDAGVCEVSVSVENADADGFDLKIDFSNPVPPVHIQSPAATLTRSWSVTYHYSQACYVGTWEAENIEPIPPLYVGPGTGGPNEFTEQRGGGPVTLDIALTGATLSTDEVFYGQFLKWVPFFGEPAQFVEGSKVTRAIQAGGGVGAFPTEGGVGKITIFPVGAATLGVTFESTGISGGGTRQGISYTLSGTYSCPGSLTLSGRPFGALVFRKTSNVPPPTILSKEVWQQEIEAQAKPGG
jgi:hypothetical protein